ncbi:bifunctional serine/threonine-protein kinase/formylglycine-generating enzyme family protein [Polyangium aurulentum]|uniref:bifunctional serine/threonine-protein kinase/formylglycine-generating enzyme family protein n=1 Tax=Polyangium aurulentum TaxID=2567896 RepID=UPI0010AEDB14|nr:bifunctional serine/threonine-protein kinase/formylglycine-generating enzyme family protein [Polyangium aurulentum]UQA60294.1 protein kinase [Polyangium aurulentum]
MTITQQHSEDHAVSALASSLAEPQLPGEPNAPVSVRCERHSAVPASLAERYEDIEFVGEGGMGTVYRGRDARLGRTVALKLLKGDDPELFRRFIQEARAQARITHEHVCRVYEAGQVDGEPYIAMQFIEGEPLSAIAPRMTLRQKVRVILEVSAAVHEAHRLGLIHRDIKPGNVLVEEPEEGTYKPYVMDFGLARELSERGLTVTGAVIGTPAYMPPEQALGDIRAMDRHSDVYSLGATLYELLAGRTPFVAEHPLRLLMMAAYEEPTPLRKVKRDVPVDLETIVMKCLEREPDRRYPSARALADDLERFLDGEPVQARRASLGYVLRKRARKHWLALAVPMALVLLLVGFRIEAQREREQLVAGYEEKARAAREEGKSCMAEAEKQRAQALALFDPPAGETADRARQRRDLAERTWDEAVEASRKAEVALASASSSLETAHFVDPSRPGVVDALGDVDFDRLLLAEWFHHPERRNDLARRLLSRDPLGHLRARLEASPRLYIEAKPRGATVRLARYEDAGERRKLGAPISLGMAPLENVVVSAGPGSYVLSFEAAGHAPVRLPILLGRGEESRVSVELPSEGAIPAGYVYVPPGRYLAGSPDFEGLRRGFFAATPLREARTEGYLIGRTEVTYGDWLAFLRALPPDERATHLPASRSHQGDIALQQLEDGTFLLTMGIGEEITMSREGERLHLRKRTRMGEMDWQRMPVAGVPLASIEAYLAWLDRTGRLRGARLCDEHEWERAARGADDRRFPHGDRLDPDDANFDETYGRQSGAFAPDEVGAHPASESPFGVLDMVGNVAECVRSKQGPEELLMRGGAFYYDSASAWIPNRTAIEPGTRDATVGVRVCASYPLPLPFSQGSH